MAKLWQRSSDPKTSLPLKEVSLGNFKISNPSVIFLSGIFTTNNKPAHIAEGMEEIETLLKGRPEITKNPDIYALSHNDLGTIFNIAAYNGAPQKAYSKSAKAMADAVLLPLVTDNGKPLPVHEACRNLRNVTFVAYSAGTVFAQEMFNAALKGMTTAGYAEKDARHVLQEVVLISLATVSRPTEEKERFTTLYLAASNDIAVALKNRIWKPLRDMFNVSVDTLKIRRLSANSLLITTELAEKMWHWRDTPDGTREKAEISPLVPKRLKVASHHEMPHYTTHDDEHNRFAKLVLNGLVNAVNRTARPEVLDLLAPTTARTPQEAAAYHDRIDKALEAGLQNDSLLPVIKIKKTPKAKGAKPPKKAA
ncbi:MAG: hypothetical protein PW788_07165 [Micavibrio sp.]|nr:hypothetical protein [Micavibrio sp.]